MTIVMTRRAIPEMHPGLATLDIVAKERLLVLRREEQ
jgi:hypothetical protein